MESQSIILGETCLDDYVSGPFEAQEIDKIKLLEAKVSEIDGFLIENSKDEKSFEEQILENTRKNRDDYLQDIKELKLPKKYKTLDLSFLKMSNTINYEKRDFKLPRFAIFPFNGGESNNFSLTYNTFYKKINELSLENLSRLPEVIKDNLFEDYKENLQNFRNYGNKTMLTGMWLGGIFGALSAGIPCGIAFNDVGAGLIGAWIGGALGCGFGASISGNILTTDNPKTIEFSTDFHGLIPNETKTKAKYAEKYFNKDIYLVSETKPENWNQREIKIQGDPLLIGIHKDKAYLIDHFDTTPLEHHIKSEFTS